MRRAGVLLAKSFHNIFEMISAGTATRDIDRALEKVIVDGGAKPAFKGYRAGGVRPYPAATCISIDTEIVHGIPSKRTLSEGQIVGIDAGLEIDGWFADMACSFLVGETDELHRKLWRVTRESLYKGIEQARTGNFIEDIGSAVQDHVESNGFNVIRELVGHGIGSRLHEDPQVPNFRQPGSSVRLQAGMTLAIEPMVSAGGWRIKVKKDGWTAVTKDGSPSGHFEHTVLVTDGEPEILTLLEDGRDPWQITVTQTE